MVKPRSNRVLSAGLLLGTVLVLGCKSQNSGGDATGGSPGTGGATGSAGGHWVGTWTGAPQLTETGNLPPTPLSNLTLRQVVHVSLGGSQIRVRLSNEFGDGPVTVNQAHVAVCPATPVNSTIDTTTDKALSFSGSASTTIATGMAVWSDPIDFSLAALSNLAITTAFGSVPTNVTGHPGSRTTSYEQAGVDVSAANIRLTSEGRAKLIDFGTLTSFGRCREIAGTPSGIAPEAFEVIIPLLQHKGQPADLAFGQQQAELGMAVERA